jgi:hypothetical protein
MSDEDVIGTNLEDDGPAIEAPAPVAAAEPAPAEPAAPAEPEDEAVEVAGQRLVPLAALQSARAEAKTLREQAERAVQLEAQWREAQPYVEFLRNNRDLLIQRQQPEPTPAPQAPQADPDALEAARLMDFYKPDGTPDTDKGARWLALQEKRAERIADARVRPILQQTAQDQAAINFQRALQIKDANGETPSLESLQAVWQAMPPDLVADQRVAGVLAATALGLDRMRNPRKATVPTPPPALVTENSGGNPRTRPVLSPLEERIASERGISATKWAENTRSYQPGRPAVLED